MGHRAVARGREIDTLKCLVSQVPGPELLRNDVFPSFFFSPISLISL